RLLAFLAERKARLRRGLQRGGLRPGGLQALDLGWARRRAALRKLVRVRPPEKDDHTAVDDAAVVRAMVLGHLPSSAQRRRARRRRAHPAASQGVAVGCAPCNPLSVLSPARQCAIRMAPRATMGMRTAGIDTASRRARR